MPPLVRPLFDGPLDLVGDVHGEADALRAVLGHLGYDPAGRHPSGRRLVFVGDLTDRGPDSPAVVALVGEFVDAGRAQAILGNHEVNLLEGKRKHGNAWFFDEPESLDKSGRVVPQAPADPAGRDATLRLFASLPLVLERPDLRVVHACWDPAAVDAVRHETDVVETVRRHRARIRSDLDGANVTDPAERDLALQNGNPVKLLVSGPEHRVAVPFEAGGKVRRLGRVPWWDDYTDAAFCVFGHYWRRRLPGETSGDHLFDDARPFAPLGRGRTTCIDYSVGKRWMERLAGTKGASQVWLAALRWPERELVLEDGRRVALA